MRTILGSFFLSALVGWTGAALALHFKFDTSVGLGVLGLAGIIAVTEWGIVWEMLSRPEKDSHLKIRTDLLWQGVRLAVVAGIASGPLGLGTGWLLGFGARAWFSTVDQVVLTGLQVIVAIALPSLLSMIVLRRWFSQSTREDTSREQ